MKALSRTVTTVFVVLAVVQAVWLPLTHGKANLCPPLPALNRDGPVVTVTAQQAGDLPSIVKEAESGTTILLADGTYVIGERVLVFRTPHVVFRSASGNQEAVVLDGKYDTATMVQVGAPHITITDMTIRRTRHHPIQFIGNGHHALLYNLHFVDAGQQLLKVSTGAVPPRYSDYGTVACSLFELTHEGRAHIETFDGEYSCYTGGIDAHSALGWHVHDNVFRNIYCTNGSLAEHAIHFWKTSKNTIAERNTIINCARGIGFGLGEAGVHRQYGDRSKLVATEHVGHIGGIIRNNVIFGNIGRFFDTGISLEQAVQASVYHNTVISTGGTFSSIDSRFAHSDPMIVNNLVRPRMTIRSGARPNNIGNVEIRSLTLFVDPIRENLHLAETAMRAIDKGIRLNDLVVDDIDGEPRDAIPDVGADEYVAPSLP